MDVRRLLAHAEVVEELSVLVEDLNAMIGAVIHEDVPRLRVQRHAVDVVHVVGPLFIRRRALHAPIE